MSQVYPNKVIRSFILVDVRATGILLFYLPMAIVFSALNTFSPPVYSSSILEKSEIKQVDEANVDDKGFRLIHEDNKIVIQNISELKKSKEKPKKPDADSKTKVIIKKSPNFKFYNSNEEARSQKHYMRALQITVDSDVSSEMARKVAENKCRYFSNSRRKHYFVDVLNAGDYKLLDTIFCRDVVGAMMLEQPAPEPYKLEQIIELDTDGVIK